MSTRKHRHGAMRLVSAMLAFALMIAYVVGGHAHAAGHHSAAGPATACAYLSHQDGSAPVAVAAKAGAQDQSQRSGGPAKHFDACDFMCHGGVAILVTPCFSYVHAKGPQASIVADAVHLMLAASLERPPRSAIRA